MNIIFNDFYDKRVLFIYTQLKLSQPRYKVWYKTSDGIYRFKFQSSTFPEYSRFAYTKKPKDWHLESSNEKKKHRYYYQFNTKGILKILVKSLTRKPLTEIQGNFLEELFKNFLDYEKMMLEEFQTNILDYELHKDDIF